MRTIYLIRIKDTVRPSDNEGGTWCPAMYREHPPGSEFWARIWGAPAGIVWFTPEDVTKRASWAIPGEDVDVIQSAVVFDSDSTHVDLGYVFEQRLPLDED